MPRGATVSGRSRHINIQEITETLIELMRLAQGDPAPQRALNGTDSSVALGAWAKGRSPSPALLAVLRRAAGWQVFGSNDLGQFKLGTKGKPLGRSLEGGPAP